MKEIKLNSVEKVLKTLNSLPNHYIFRGHPDAGWSLESSLERVIGTKWSTESAKNFEDYSLTKFKSKFHLYDQENIKPCSKLGWLSLMQHYGVPTRLVDFTESPFVALYFALETYDPGSRSDFAIFAIDYSGLMEESIQYIAKALPEFQETQRSASEKSDKIFESIIDLQRYDIAWITEPTELNARLDRQAGTFLLSGNPGRRIMEVLELDHYRNVAVTKYRIPAALHTGLFALLRKMNINSKSLYGDLVGLARSIRMELTIYGI